MNNPLSRFPAGPLLTTVRTQVSGPGPGRGNDPGPVHAPPGGIRAFARPCRRTGRAAVIPLTAMRIRPGTKAGDQTTPLISGSGVLALPVAALVWARGKESVIYAFGFIPSGACSATTSCHPNLARGSTDCQRCSRPDVSCTAAGCHLIGQHALSLDLRGQTSKTAMGHVKYVIFYVLLRTRRARFPRRRFPGPAFPRFRWLARSGANLRSAGRVICCCTHTAERSWFLVPLGFFSSLAR